MKFEPLFKIYEHNFWPDIPLSFGWDGWEVCKMAGWAISTRILKWPTLY